MTQAQDLIPAVFEKLLSQYLSTFSLSDDNIRHDVTVAVDEVLRTTAINVSLDDITAQCDRLRSELIELSIIEWESYISKLKINMTE